ncbi:hypothetical protein HDE_07165 [Halotydeus destructor]|nr:hypothetical protein HDE_07165 [Halotydeus destructor]
MRLSLILASYRPIFHGYKPTFPGNVTLGKHKFVPPVNRTHKFYIMRQMLYEEEVMMYLRSPCISEKQEQAYLQSVGKAKPDHADDFMFKKLAKPERQRYAADYLVALDKSRKFEIIE